jgi:hypothetical protein
MSIGEMDLVIATEIQKLIQLNTKFSLPFLDSDTYLEADIIVDPVIIAGIKQFFRFETIYNNSSYNFIEEMYKYLQYHSDLQIVNSLLTVNSNYSDLVYELTDDIYNSRNKDCRKKDYQNPPQLFEAIGLLTLKRRMLKYKNWELGITKIIGTYLNSEYYENYIDDSHPELY